MKRATRKPKRFRPASGGRTNGGRPVRGLSAFARAFHLNRPDSLTHITHGSPLFHHTSVSPWPHAQGTFQAQAPPTHDTALATLLPACSKLRAT